MPDFAFPSLVLPLPLPLLTVCIKHKWHVNLFSPPKLHWKDRGSLYLEENSNFSTAWSNCRTARHKTEAHITQRRDPLKSSNVRHAQILANRLVLFPPASSMPCIAKGEEHSLLDTHGYPPPHVLKKKVKRKSWWTNRTNSGGKKRRETFTKKFKFIFSKL
jgi:hypothetical protein